MTEREIFDLIRLSLGYRTTVGPQDKTKVEKAIQGLPSTKPSSRLGQAAWGLARRINPVVVPPPPPPPPPPPAKLAPQTYNRGSRGQDAKYCTAGLPFVDGAFVDAGGFRYDDQGLCLGGRSGNPVDGLKPADMMDGLGPCDPYEWMGRSFPPWPAGSYEV